MSVQQGTFVKVEYEGTLDDGTVFDTSKHGDHSHPLEFTVGSGEVIAGFDNALLGMNVGDKKTIVLESNEAYGEHNEKLVRTFPRSMVPKEDIEEGQSLVLSLPDGRQLPAQVVELEEESVTLDLNHPLAGKRLHFSITLLEILPN